MGVVPGTTYKRPGMNLSSKKFLVFFLFQKIKGDSRDPPIMVPPYGKLPILFPYPYAKSLKKTAPCRSSWRVFWDLGVSFPSWTCSTGRAKKIGAEGLGEGEVLPAAFFLVKKNEV